MACSTAELADALARLRRDDLAGPVTIQAIGFLDELFAGSPDALGATMAGRAEAGVGSPDTVAAAAVLAADLIAALGE